MRSPENPIRALKVSSQDHSRSVDWADECLLIGVFAAWLVLCLHYSGIHEGISYNHPLTELISGRQVQARLSFCISHASYLRITANLLSDQFDVVKSP